MNNLLLRMGQFFGFIPTGESFINKLKKERGKNQDYKDTLVKGIHEKEVFLEWDGSCFNPVGRTLIEKERAIVRVQNNKLILCRVLGFTVQELSLEIYPMYFIDEDHSVAFDARYWHDIRKVTSFGDYLKYRAIFAVAVTKEDYDYYMSIAAKGRRLK